jgi:hypothetical protein
MRSNAAALSLVAAALFVSGCGYKQDEFSTDYSTAICLMYEQCDVLTEVEGYADAAECKTAIAAQVDADAGRCPDYDKKVAVDCVNGVNQMTCEALWDNQWPASCNQVCPDGAAKQSFDLDTGDAG